MPNPNFLTNLHNNILRKVGGVNYRTKHPHGSAIDKNIHFFTFFNSYLILFISFCILTDKSVTFCLITVRCIIKVLTFIKNMNVSKELEKKLFVINTRKKT